MPPIIQPPLWESRGNVPALVRLLTALIPRGVEHITSQSQIEPILGIFQKLMSSKANEAYAFDLIEAIIDAFPVATIQPYFPPLLTMLLTRLQSSNSPTFSLRFTKFYHFVSARSVQGYGADLVASTAEGIQAGVFPPLYLTIILPSTQKIARPIDRKIAVISLTNTLASSTAFADRYAKGWAFTCEALLKLLENPPLPVDRDDPLTSIAVDDDSADLAFAVDFTQLVTCRRPYADHDRWAEVRDVKPWVGSSLREANLKTDGRVRSSGPYPLTSPLSPTRTANISCFPPPQIDKFVQERLSPEARTVLVQYMAAYA